MQDVLCQLKTMSRVPRTSAIGAISPRAISTASANASRASGLSSFRAKDSALRRA
jgi:hypothetical protein